MRNKYILLGFIALVITAEFFFLRSNNSSKQDEIKSPQENITIKGSDTEVQLVSNLAEVFSKKDPQVKISVAGGGSGVGIAALINKEIDLANSSRKIKLEELDQAKNKKLDPQEFILAIDGLSVIVYPDNPINKLTLDQIGKIYRGEVTNWNELGGNNSEIVLYGRQNTSGTYTFFRDLILKADYSPKLRNMEGNQAIVDAIKVDKSGIGYVGVGYVKGSDSMPRNDIKIVLIAKDSNATPISPLNEELVKKGEYPISRRIFQYLPQLPKKNSGMERFLRFEISIEGQDIIERAGFYSLSENDISQNDSFFEKVK